MARQTDPHGRRTKLWGALWTDSGHGGDLRHQRLAVELRLIGAQGTQVRPVHWAGLPFPEAWLTVPPSLTGLTDSMP